MLCCASVLLLVGVTLLYAFFDVNYYIRIIFTLGFGRLFQKKKKVLESNTIYGFSTTQDANVFLRHMNDARYLRELDFGRYHYYDRCGLFEAMFKKKGNALQGATSIRYRRPIQTFSLYKIETKMAAVEYSGAFQGFYNPEGGVIIKGMAVAEQLIYWDDKSLYLEQKFITLGDNFIRAIAFSKQNIVGVDVNELMMQMLGSDVQKPELLPELDHWLKSMEITSSKLRKKD